MWERGSYERSLLAALRREEAEMRAPGPDPGELLEEIRRISAGAAGTEKG